MDFLNFFSIIIIALSFLHLSCCCRDEVEKVDNRVQFPMDTQLLTSAELDNHSLEDCEKLWRKRYLHRMGITRKPRRIKLIHGTIPNIIGKRRLDCPKKIYELYAQRREEPEYQFNSNQSTILEQTKELNMQKKHILKTPYGNFKQNIRTDKSEEPESIEYQKAKTPLRNITISAPNVKIPPKAMFPYKFNTVYRPAPKKAAVDINTLFLNAERSNTF